eukprot:Partr_v1_DN28591_c1_g1_i2_m73046 putative syntaxin binding protein
MGLTNKKEFMATSNSSAGGLKSMVRRHILENIIRSVAQKSGSKYRVLVMDRQSIHLVNAVIKMSELTDEDITLVEPLEKRRQPYPTLEAIYLVAPTSDSVVRIIEDFTRNKYNKDGRLYSGVHLFFTAALDDRLFHRLKTSTAINHIKTLREVYMDFVAIESQAFTLDRNESLISFFGTEVTGEQSAKEYSNVAKQISSLCITMGEFPLIRYSTANNFDRITSKVAALVQEELDRYSKMDDQFPRDDPTISGPNRAQLIIVDRTIDTVAPLLHEFTYQAMANDLLPLVDNGTKFKYSYTSATEGKREREAILDETSDPLWASIRHSHIAECINSILGNFNKFLSENRAAVGAQNAGKGGVSSLNELKETLSAVPQFQDMKAKFSVHINITQECMTVFSTRRLNDLAAVEQDLATGETADGDVPRKIEIDMIPLLDNKNVSIYDKVRLLMLYIISKDGLKEEDRRRLFEHANISSELSTAITNLALLGVKLAYSKQKKATKNTKKSKKRDDDVPYELSRYQPVLKKVMTEACEGVLSPEVFPFVKKDVSGSTKSTPASSTISSPAVITPVTATSLRSTKPSWHNRGPSEASKASTMPERVEDTRRKGGKIIIFVVGGMTYSEMRAAYEVTNAFNKDVIIGGTHITTPTRFVDDIRCLRQPLIVKEDIPIKATPEETKSSQESLDGSASKKKNPFKSMLKSIAKKDK